MTPRRRAGLAGAALFALLGAAGGIEIAGAPVAGAWTGKVAVAKVECVRGSQGTSVTFTNPEDSAANLTTSADEQGPIAAGGSANYLHSKPAGWDEDQKVVVQFMWPATGETWTTTYTIHWHATVCGATPTSSTTPTTSPEQGACVEAGGTWQAAIGSPAVCSMTPTTPAVTAPLSAPGVDSPDTTVPPAPDDTTAPPAPTNPPTSVKQAVKQGPPRTAPPETAALPTTLPVTGGGEVIGWITVIVIAVGLAMWTAPKIDRSIRRRVDAHRSGLDRLD